MKKEINIYTGSNLLEEKSYEDVEKMWQAFLNENENIILINFYGISEIIY